MNNEKREFIKNLASLKELNKNIGGQILFITFLYLCMLLLNINFIFKLVIALSYVIIMINIKKYNTPERPYLLISFTCFIGSIAFLLEVYNNFYYPIIINILVLVISYFIIKFLSKGKPLKNPLSYSSMKKDLLLIIIVEIFLNISISQITDIPPEKLSSSMILVVVSAYGYNLYKKYKNEIIKLKEEGVDIDFEIKEYLSENK